MLKLNVWFQDRIIEICLTKHTKLKLYERERFGKDCVERTTCTYTLKKGVPYLHIHQVTIGGEYPRDKHSYYSAVKEDQNVKDLIEEGPITLWRGPGRK